MTLLCAICLYVPQEPHKARPAVTIIDGLAVCDDHMNRVHHSAINFAIQQEKV